MSAFSPSHIQAVDKKFWSPDERATGVHQFMELTFRQLIAKGVKPDDLPTQWDRLHYAVGFMNQMALAIGDDLFISVARAAAAFMLNAHYSHPDQLYGTHGDKRTLTITGGPDLRGPFDDALVHLRHGLPSFEGPSGDAVQEEHGNSGGGERDSGGTSESPESGAGEAPHIIH